MPEPQFPANPILAIPAISIARQSLQDISRRTAYDIGDKLGFDINGRSRIADGLIPTQSISEVKNVGYLGLTQQIGDYSDYAQQNGLRFDLYTRPDTTLSRPLQNAINSGRINRLDIPQ